MTRDEILGIKEGDPIEHSLTGDAHWTLTKVTRIFGGGTNIHGKVYICLYVKFTESSEISCSTHENEPRARLRLPNP